MDSNRLKSQLLNTGLQNKDNPLFQFLDQLLGAINSNTDAINTISGSVTNINNTIVNLGTTLNNIIFMGDEISAIEPINLPGPKGDKGDTGIGFPGLDGLDGDISLIPGPTGPIGPIGPQGIHGLDGSDNNEIVIIPPLINPQALTKVDDTNVTLTLGGNPTIALLNVTSLTLGWTGQLSATRGGTGVNTSGSTGIAQVSAGTWAISDTLARPILYTDKQALRTYFGSGSNQAIGFGIRQSSGDAYLGANTDQIVASDNQNYFQTGQTALRMRFQPWAIDVAVAGTAGSLITWVTNVVTLSTAGLLTVTTLALTSRITSYQNIATAGYGTSAVRTQGRGLLTIGATITSYTVSGGDGIFTIYSDIKFITSTSFTFTVRVTWTDETGTAQTFDMLYQNGGLVIQTLANGTFTSPIAYSNVPLTIRAQNATTITIATVGTFTTVQYNIDVIVFQVGN